MDYIVAFSERLSDLMIEKELNGKTLAKQVGLSGSHISKWLRRKNAPDLKNMLLLADKFGCSIDYLIGRSDCYPALNYKGSLPPFPKQLRKMFNEKRITRYGFVKNTRFTEAHLYNWDKGVLPQLSTLIELADLFGVSVDYLIGRED